MDWLEPRGKHTALITQLWFPTLALLSLSRRRRSLALEPTAAMQTRDMEKCGASRTLNIMMLMLVVSVTHLTQK